MKLPTIERISDRHADLLRDESRTSGTAATVCFPACEEDVCAVLADMHGSSTPVTVQGARTGIAGGAVPNGGHLMNLSRMRRIAGCRFDGGSATFFLTVEPGVLLSQVTDFVSTCTTDTTEWSPDSLESLELLRNSEPRHFAVDPTETSASIGGMAACNASGAHSFGFGPMRRHVNALRVVLADGTPLIVRRGGLRASGRTLRLKLDDGRNLFCALPSYAMPSSKNVAGYFVQDNMELLDLFIGAEGTLGVITEIELRLAPRPQHSIGIVAFLPSEDAAVNLVRAVRGEDVPRIDSLPGEGPVALEYFDRGALDLLRQQKATNPAFSELPDIPSSHEAAVFMEFTDDEEAMMESIAAVTGIIAAVGGSEDSAWLADSDRERKRLTFFRHAVPEAVNLTIDQRRKELPTITKLGTDMSVPDLQLKRVMTMYRRDLAESGLESVIFGHIGNNHVHVNILPRSVEEFARGKQLYNRWAEQVVAMGGSPAAEHGVGKMKRHFLKLLYGEEGVSQMRLVKELFDPGHLLNRGNWFEQ